MPNEEHHETPPAAGEQLARWLRALAAEVERDPALAKRIAAVEGASVAPTDAPPAVAPPVMASTPVPAPTPTDIAATPPAALKHRRRSSRYGGPTVAGRTNDLGSGVPDPFALLAASDEAGLRLALATLRAGTLRAIIRAHHLDPDGKLPPEATEKRMITLIVAATKRAAKTKQPTSRKMH